MPGTPHCRAESENGHRTDDPSQDGLFDLISDLNDSDNSFVVIQSAADDPAWFATVAVLDGGGFEVVLRDSARREHEVVTDTDIGGIAHDLITWLSARD